jgi:hypothetical protein
MTVAASAAAQHTKQKSNVLSYRETKPEIPGDYNIGSNTPPQLPPGIEAFQDINTIHIGYLSILCGMALLFLVITSTSRVSRTSSFTMS